MGVFLVEIQHFGTSLLLVVLYDGKVKQKEKLGLLRFGLQETKTSSSFVLCVSTSIFCLGLHRQKVSWCAAEILNKKTIVNVIYCCTSFLTVSDHLVVVYSGDNEGFAGHLVYIVCSYLCLYRWSVCEML